MSRPLPFDCSKGLFLTTGFVEVKSWERVSLGEYVNSIDPDHLVNLHNLVRTCCSSICPKDSKDS